MKRTPLKRGTYKLKRSELKSKSRLQSKKPLPFRSEKTKAKYVERRALVERVLRDRPLCEACSAYAMCENMFRSDIQGVPTHTIYPSSQLHEIVLRSQSGDILDERIIISICDTCHKKVGDDPGVAYLMGLYLKSYQYDDEHVAEACKTLESLRDGIIYTPFYVED